MKISERNSKKPKDELFQNSKKVRVLGVSRLRKIIAIDNVISTEFLKNEFKLDIVTVDSTVERAPLEETQRIIESYSVPTVRTGNPSDQITEDLWGALKTAKALVKITVDGKEGLTTLPLTLHAHLRIRVAYG